jgi:hypothetical protein
VIGMSFFEKNIRASTVQSLDWFMLNALLQETTTKNEAFITIAQAL